MSTSHRDQLEEKLREALWGILSHWDDMLPDAPTTGTSAKVGGIGPGSKAPAPVSVLSLRRETCEVLADWADLVRDSRDLNPVIDRGDAKGLARFLETHSEWVAAHETGPEAVDQVRSLAARVTAVAAPTGQREFLVAVCVVLDCGGMLSAFLPGDNSAVSQVRCSLDRSHTWAPEQWGLVGAAIRQDEEESRAGDEYLSIPRLVERLKELYGYRVSRQAIRNWHVRGKLAPKDRDLSRRHLFSLREVKALTEGAPPAADPLSDTG